MQRTKVDWFLRQQDGYEISLVDLGNFLNTLLSLCYDTLAKPTLEKKKT